MRPALAMALCLVIALPALAAGPGETDAPRAGVPDERAIIEEMDRVIDETPPIRPKDENAAQSLLKKGIAAHDRGDYERAISFYQQALEKNPLLANAHYEMAFSYSYQGKQEQALASVIRALTLDPKMEIAYVIKGNILDDLGHPEAALAEYDRLLEIKPDSLMGHLNKGITLLRQEDTDGAEAAFRKAEEIAPDAPSVHLRLAQLARVRGHEYEEQDHLERFVELGAKDSRLPQVKERLDELKRSEINIQAGDPYMAISLAAAMIKSRWRAELHRARFPEARGYFPTFEEEREVADMILSLWRQEKTENPEATHPGYDLLLRVSDAGFLDEYLQYRHQNRFGERGAAWRQGHQERMEHFLSWADKEGLLPGNRDQSSAGDPPGKKKYSAREFLRAAYRAGEDSSRSYVLKDDVTVEDARRYRADEGAAFRKRLDLSGPDEVDCGAVFAGLNQALEVLNVGPRFLELFRCWHPGDPEWEEGKRLLSRVGWTMDDLDVDIPLAITSQGEETVINGKQAWVFYGIAKAAWRHEPAFRLAWEGPEDYVPTVQEELLALGAAMQSYVESRSGEGESGDPEKADSAGSEDEADPKGFEQDLLMDRMLEVNAAQQLRGFVLFEILHKRYGVSLASLSAADAREVSRYMDRWVLIKRQAD